MSIPIPNARVSLAEIAARCGGSFVSAPGDSFAVGLCPLDAPLPGCVTFTRDPNISKILTQLSSCNVAAVLLSEAPHEPLPTDCPPLLVVKDPFNAMIDLAPLFFRTLPVAPGISSKANIATSANVSPSATISEFCSLGEDVVVEQGAVLHPSVTIYAGARIGARTVLHSGVTVREGCIIGSDCIIHNGASIGADGFGYIPDPKEGLKKVPQVGIVRIGNHVEIGANSCIDRAAFGVTEIGDGTKLDNLVQVGHNARLGRFVIVCGQVGLAGSSVIGNGVIIGAQSGVADHRKVPDKIRLAARSGVTSDLEAGDYGGMPAIPASDWKRQTVALARLPKTLRKLRSVLREGDD